MAGYVATAPTISGLASQLLQRQMAQEDQQAPFRQPLIEPTQSPHPQKAFSPETAATLGGVADAASTYSFMKQHGNEDNAMLSGHGPAATAGGVLGSWLAMRGVRELLRKAGANGLADAMAGSQGAMQMGYAGNNFAHQINDSHNQASAQQYPTQINSALKQYQGP
jgi:hypothetical protein